MRARAMRGLRKIRHALRGAAAACWPRPQPPVEIRVKASTRQAHAARVDAVLARLQSALAQGEPVPALEELAGLAHVSPFHFHRIWRALTGESLGRTVARLRLLRALHLLEDPDSTITSIALASGFDSSQSLARAFRETLHAAPTDLRGDMDRIATARLRLQVAGMPEAPAALQVEVVSLSPFKVVALRNRGAFADLDAAFGRLFAWAAEAGRVESIVGLHGVPLGDHRDVPADAFEFDCAIRIDAHAPVSQPLRVLPLGGGCHARARHLGPYEGIEGLVDRILGNWLPHSGRALRDVPIHYEFLDDPESVPAASLRADIYVPLQD